MHHIGESYATLRRYAPQFLDVLKLRAAPAAKGVLNAIDVLRGMNSDSARKVPADVPTAFIKPRWAKLVLTDDGIDRRYYELCALSELKNALRSGDVWVQGSRQFTHLKNGDTAKDKTLLMTTILADAINLGLTKMAESCPGTTYARLSWLQAWHVRDETYSTALAELVNAQFRQPFAENWGDGTTSSSDGQNCRTSSKAESTGHINPKYGSSPGRTFYTHISDQYAPFSAKVVNVGVRDSTYVLDGLLYHESDLRI